MSSPKDLRPPVLDISNLSFAWPSGPVLLDIPNLRLEPGERVFLRGASGSGKSTVLSLIAGVLRPPNGAVCVLGEDMGAMSGAARDSFRADHLGVVFQMFNLLPYLNVIDNVLLSCEFSQARARSADSKGGQRQEAERLLGRLGIQRELFKRPSNLLSVGQQQRVAVARALIGAPELILADEPTSALDEDARDAFLALLLEECDKSGSSLIFVSHDRSLASFFERSIDLREINKAAAETVS